MNKGFLSSIWKAHSTLLPWVGLFGVGIMYGLLPKAATIAHAANPNATIIDTVLQMWSMMAGNVIDFALPGGGIILGQLASGIGGIFNMVAGAIGPALPLPSIPAP